MTRNISVCAIFLAGFLAQRSGYAAEQFYSLGGPCQNAPAFNRQPIEEAKKNGSWDKAIELQKLQVRGGCEIEYRWLELLKTVLEAGRETEAVQVMQEMDSRGFDFSVLVAGEKVAGEKDPAFETFMARPAFRDSPVGKKIERLEAISNERRARFRAVLKTLPVSQRPPENYVAKGACPFECCRFGDWTVLEGTDLVAAPGSTRVVGAAPKGSRVIALTGEVHLKPEPIAVLMKGDLPKDTIAFVLDYEGEGYAHVYTQGRIVSVPLAYADYCFKISESCWGETLLPSKERTEPVWWVKIKLADGTVGWTNRADHFGNKDACG
jgi:hypothetical protein